MKSEKTVPDNLRAYLKNTGPAVIAFSGGMDSSYLLYSCRESGIDAYPCFVRNGFQTEKELESARGLAGSLGFTLDVISADAFSDADLIKNGEDRCYVCKNRTFRILLEKAAEYGTGRVADGTNLSDDPASRPGMKALGELGILSPLRECGLGKAEISELSRAAGLPTWNLPSNSCLATRIPCGTPITRDALVRVSSAEEDLGNIGLSGIRVRDRGSSAVLELPEESFSRLDGFRDEAVKILLKYYSSAQFSIRRTSGRWRSETFWRRSGAAR